MKVIRPADAKLFWIYLEKENSYLGRMLRLHLVNEDDVVAAQPRGMSDTLYKEYKVVLQKWLTANELI